jgi:hypothetical protein
MIETKKVSEWLTKIGKTGPEGRAWLSEQMNVSAPTVKGWLLAGRPITGPAEKLIRMLMEPARVISADFTVDEYEQIEECAAAEGISAREWMKKELKKALGIQHANLESSATIIPGSFSGYYPHPPESGLRVAET